MCTVLRLAFLFTLVSAALTGAVGAKGETCSIARYGKLTMFSGEPGNIEIPCKYILTEMTCGDYMVKVTGGSASDPDKIFRYTPSTAWVKVEKTSEGKVFKARTDVQNFEYKEYVWNVKEYESDFMPDVVDYVDDAAIISVPDVFEIRFSNDGTLSVTCMDKSFSNTPYPESLCGDGKGKDVVKSDRKTIFSGLKHRIEVSYTLSLRVLNNTRVTQSTQCSGIARKFQKCGDLQADAIARCARVFADRSLSGCLNTKVNAVNAFRLCIKYAGCTKRKDIATGAETVCNFLKELTTLKDCEDEYDEIRKEITDCPAA